MSTTPLFHHRALRRALESAHFPADLDTRHSRLLPLLRQMKSGELARTKETTLQDEFLKTVFGEILGYRSRFAESGQAWDIQREVNVARSGQQPVDGAIGWFVEAQLPHVHAVIELKGAAQALDRAGGRSRTPVQQVWDYANEVRTCRWILLSNYRETRLYHRGRSRQDLEVFRLESLEDPAEFRRFYLLLARENLLPAVPGGQAPLDRLLEESEKVQLEITDKLYADYSVLREALFDDLRLSHSHLTPLEVLSATQKLLDRVLFIAFAEDRKLLPAETIKQTLVEDFYERPMWNNLKQVFRWVDKGHAAKDFSAFNGGLFAIDEVLDEMEPSNTTLKRLEVLSSYDFSEDVSVEVLGHIFEQSISDLEVLRSRATGTEAPDLSGRKRHGVFYTPAFVTRYLVDQTIGRVCQDRLEQILAEHAPDKVRGSNKQAAATAKAWEEYRDWLRGLRVLDPACGSGAFLVAAFDRLHLEFERVNHELLTLRGKAEVELFDLNRSILNNNLFGVDLNPESIEITRLSLWLKTAAWGKPLTWLDANVRCGNSVVDDPAVAPRAFDWSRGSQVGEANEFDEAERTAIAAAWRDGFDVVIGNPPYVRQELLGGIKGHLKEHFRAWHGMADLFVYFFERGLSVLKPGGRLGFIVANKWLKGGYAAPLRKFLAAECTVEELIDFGHAPIFPDADAFPSIIVLRRDPPPAGHRFQATIFPREELAEVGVEELVRQRRVGIPQAELGEEPWSLEPPEVRALMDKLKERGTRLEEVVGSGPMYGVKTGCNEAFIIDRATRDAILVEDPGSSEIIRPYLRGRDIQRWAPEWDGQYMIFARRGIDIQRYPGVLRHLEGFRTRLEPKPAGWPEGRKWEGRKPGTYQWYEIQDAVDYHEKFGEGKIVYQEIQFNSCYAFDSEGLYANNKVFFIPTLDPWILAVLNSPLLWWHNWRYLSHMKDEALNPSGAKMIDLPIPPPTPAARAEAAELVATTVAATRSSQRRVRDLLMWLRVEHSIDPPGNALSDPAMLSTEAFIAEVRKRRPRSAPRLSPVALRELHDLHQAERPPLLQARQQVRAAELRLSELVNAAFGLGPEEVDLLRRTAPPRTPLASG